MKQELLANIPKIDILLQDDRMIRAAEKWGRASAADALRLVADEFRQDILSGSRDTAPDAEDIIPAALRRLERGSAHSLRPVINGTGVILHTNLGRAPLSARAQKAVLDAARGYTNLEYNLESGSRGSRHDHIAKILTELCGTEDAIVVNNNAAAVLLALSALARDKEVLVSRGEMVEIGGSFRIPEVCAQSGAVLREVGTTNRTRIGDYRAAVTEETGAILKVHTSNYRIVGFTEETPLESLAELARAERIPLIYDMGSGLFDGLAKYGIDEPDIRRAVQSGADLLTFSGDKLLGGAQAGLITGKRRYIEPLKHHPLMRVLRVDKMTLAALEATLSAYRDRSEARREIPVLSMITADESSLKERAERLRAQLEETAGENRRTAAAGTVFRFAAEPCEDRVGGGAAPLTALKGYAVTVEIAGSSDAAEPADTAGSVDQEGSSDAADAAESVRHMGAVPRTPEQLEQALRTAKYPLVTRVSQDRLWISVRTLMNGDEDRICEDFRDIMSTPE